MSTPPPGWSPDPGNPGPPGQFPGQPGYPGQPGQPGQFPGQPGQPGQFPGQPGQFGPPGLPGQPPPPGYVAPYNHPGYPGGYQAPPTDPLVPTDFGGWFQRVFDVFRRDFVQLALLWILPTLAVAGYSIAINLVTPGPAEMAQFEADMQTAPDPGPAAIAFLIDMFGRMLPILLIFVVVLTIAGAAAQAASFHLVVRRSDGRPTTALESVRLAAPRMLPSIGWSLLASLIIALGTMLCILPGVYLSIVFYASLSGVVVIERAGIGRCFRLIRGRFWATTGRLVIAYLGFLAYLVVASLISGLATVLSPVVGGLVYAIILFPTFVFFAAVFVVTYAELRRHESAEFTTATLASELDR